MIDVVVRRGGGGGCGGVDEARGHSAVKGMGQERGGAVSGHGFCEHH